MRLARIGAPIAWALGSLVVIATSGVPTSHLLVFAWLGSGMAAFAITDLPRRLPRFVIDWAPFMGVLFVYDKLRGIADGLLVHTRELPQIKVEAALFGKPIPTVRLQNLSTGNTVRVRVLRYDVATRTIILDPYYRMAAGTRYRLSIRIGIKDLNANRLVTQSWTFKTGRS